MNSKKYLYTLLLILSVSYTTYSNSMELVTGITLPENALNRFDVPTLRFHEPFYYSKRYFVAATVVCSIMIFLYSYWARHNTQADKK